MSGLEIRPFADEHLDDAAGLLATRHARHRRHEPLLPQLADLRPHVEAEWRQEGAAGVFAARDGKPIAYLLARPEPFARDETWMVVGIAGHAVDGDVEVVRDVYAAAAKNWLEAGLTRHGAFVPSFDAELVDAWFRLCFGASGALAMRATAPQTAVDAAIAIRPAVCSDVDDAVRLDRAMYDSMLPAPSFSRVEAPSPEELAAEWRETWSDDRFTHFVAERDERIVGQIVMYKRPANLRVPADSIDLAHAVTDPAVRGSGVGRALTAFALHWADEAGYPTMVTDWRMTNLWASRFWPRRGFRPTFLRLYRSIP